ncbi:MAG: hypothetical protein WA383_19790 [Terriglobales bacterium]
MQEPEPLVSTPEKHILHDMLRLFKKWRLVRRLRKECLSHIGKQGDGFVSREGTMWVSKGAFAQQTVEHLWRARFWSEQHRIEKLQQIHSLLESCIAEKFIDTFLREDGKRFIKTSLAGEDFCGFMDFMEFCLSKYRSLATIIIIPIVTFALGFFGPSILKKLTEKPPQKAYQSSTPAEIAQMTSPLTTQGQSSNSRNTGANGASSTRGKVPHEAPNTPPPAILQDCGGGNCAVSSGQTGGVTAGQINVDTDRHLAPKQIADIEAAKAACAAMSFIHVTASSDEAKRHAYEFINALQSAGCGANLDLPIPGLRPNVFGVWVGVRDMKNPDPSARALSTILGNADVSAPLAPMESNFFPDSTFVLVVGAKGSK